MWYGQLEEDRRLREMLGPREQGFYLDIGACEPVHHSVTMHFYESGWHGINVEPVPWICEQLRSERPRDLSLCCAISDVPEIRTFNFIVGTQLSTFDSENLATMSPGREVVEFPVNCLTLAQLCQIHISPQQPIDFLKIDVEGWERHVLAGADWATYRPKIILLEAVKPCSTTPTHGEWEDLLTAAEYDFLTTDDFNRWYIDRHNAEIAS